MIPKKLHYVWFGNDKPNEVKDNIKSWERVLSKSWEIIEWNDSNFKIKDHPFVEYHYKKKNWAFVSDYIRVWAVYTYGGFYLDTDVQLLKSLDSLVKNDFICSRTYIVWIGASTFGAKRESIILKNSLEIMKNKKIIKKQPKIMSTHIMTYSVHKYENYIANTKDTYKNGSFLLLSEDVLQLGLDGSIALHKHYAKWDDKSKLLSEDSKYLVKKQKSFIDGMTENDIANKIKERNKAFKIINKWMENHE